MSPEDVIRRFWQAIDAEDYLTAYATTATDNRARHGLPYFRSDWQCVEQARVLEIAPMGEAADTERMFTVQVELRVKPNCDGWMQPGLFASLVRESPDGPWLIQAFNTGP